MPSAAESTGLWLGNTLAGVVNTRAAQRRYIEDRSRNAASEAIAISDNRSAVEVLFMVASVSMYTINQNDCLVIFI